MWLVFFVSPPRRYPSDCFRVPRGRVSSGYLLIFRTQSVRPSLGVEGVIADLMFCPPLAEAAAPDETGQTDHQKPCRSEDERLDRVSVLVLDELEIVWACREDEHTEAQRAPELPRGDDSSMEEPVLSS